MTKPAPIPDPLDDVELPEEPHLSDEEEMRLTIERAREFERTGMGITFDDLKAWFKALDDDPKAPCPPVRKLR